MTPGVTRHPRHLAAWLTICWLLLPLSAWSEIVLPESDGSELHLDKPASRIITLAPNLAELVYAAGAGERMIATVEFSDFPVGAAVLPRIGDAFRFDLERIVSYRPDLVIAWSSGNPDAALRRLESLGLKVWRTEIRQPADIAAFLEALGHATAMEEGANEAAQAVRGKLERLERRYRGSSPVSYFYQVSEQPLFTLNGVHLVSQGLALCGGVNIFAGEGVIAPQVSREAVLYADPDVLIAPVLDTGDTPLDHWRQWPRMTAVRNGAFIHLPANEISRATPRLLDSLETGCRLLNEIRTENLDTEHE